MFRFPLFFIMAILIGFKVDAAVVNLSYEQFLELPDSQKDQWVIKTMELMVELEGRYQHEVKTTGIHSERIQRYTKIMKKLNSFFMESAYAGTAPSSWVHYGKDFANLLKSSNGKTNCIYGGWVSKVVGNYCIHPNYLGASTPQAKAYGKEASCSGRNSITCNPAIFGYKSEESKSLFCVKAGLSEAHNSSLNCMKEALSVKSGPDEDSKDVRIKNLRSRLMANPDIFKDVQKYIFQTCICESTPENLNARYHDYMRPHRTCYGMMEMLSSTACEDPKIDFDTTFFEKLRSFTNDKIKSSTSGPEIDAIYRNYLKDIKESSPDEYARLCPTDVTNGDKGKKDDSGITVTSKPDNLTPGGTIDNPITPITPGDTKPVVDKPVTNLAPVTVKGSPVTYYCKSATCHYVENDKSKKDEAPAKEEKPAKDQKQPVSPSAPAEEVKRQIACEYVITSVVDGKEEVTTPDKAPTEVPASENEKSVSITALFGSKSESFICPVTFSEADHKDGKKSDDGKPSITLSLKDKTATSQKITAEVKNDDGYTVTWYRKNFPGEKNKADAKKKKDEPIKGLAGDTGSSDDDDKSDDKSKNDDVENLDYLPNASGELEADATMKDKPYEVCAKLTSDDEDKEDSEESCVTVPALAKKRPAPPMIRPNQQPVAPPRGATNTSALGIR